MALLPVVAVDAGPAPELDALAAAAEADRAEFGLAPVTLAEAAAAGYEFVPVPRDDVSPDPFDKIFGPRTDADERRDEGVTKFLELHDSEPMPADPVLEPDDDAPRTVTMPVAEQHTEALDAVEDGAA